MKILGGKAPINLYSIAGKILLHEGQRTFVFNNPQPVIKCRECGVTQASLAWKCEPHFGQVSTKSYPPVCDINRTTAGCARRKSKSWPLGFVFMLPIIAAIKGASSLGFSRNSGIKSTLSSWPKHK